MHANRAAVLHGTPAAFRVHLDHRVRAALQARSAGRLRDPRSGEFGWKCGTTGMFPVEIQPRFTAHDTTASSGHNGGGTQI